MVKQNRSKFYGEIRHAKDEREVEIVYKKGLNTYYPNKTIHNELGSDGYLEVSDDNGVKHLRLLMEYKFDVDLTSRIALCRVLVQVLYYLHKFAEAGKIQPDVILLGTKFNCCVIHFNDLYKYLDEELDWDIAPSEAAKFNVDLIMKLKDDLKISPHIYTINDDFSFLQVKNKINDLSNKIIRKIHISEHNIATIYDYFITQVIKDMKRWNANELVSIFINLMINPSSNYIHPNKQNILVSQLGEVNIDTNRYHSFFSHFDRDYTPAEKERFTSVSDRLIEDTNRRFKGEFYTPTLWVDEAHKMITNYLGDDWRKNYSVWDCAWGTGNLTRDYHFKDLFCTTLNDSDLKMGNRYNKNAVKFQYDFLNDDVEILSPESLLESDFKIDIMLLNRLKTNRPLLFLINPPYGTAGNSNANDVKSKDGNALTEMNKLMKAHKIGAPSQQLYAQFLYRIVEIKRKFKLTNVNIGIFCPSLFLTGPSYDKLRNQLLKEFQYVDGMVFRADHFSDVRDSWGIAFTIFKSGETVNKESFRYQIKDLSEEGKIITLGTKDVYNLDNSNNLLSQWIKDKEVKDTKVITLKSSVKISNKIVEADSNALGYLINDSNNVYANAKGVYILSSKITRNIKTTPIYENNLGKCCALFAARNLVKSNWINQKDEYMQPDMTHPEYQLFENNSIIYSLFHPSSNQSSVRDIEFEGQTFTFQNNLFYMSNKEILNLANIYNNDDVYTDAKNYPINEYVYEQLSKLEFSPEAKIVLNKAREMTEKSFKFREIAHCEFPEYHLNAWNAGWYQLKQIFKNYMMEDYNEFEKCFNALAKKMESKVYELGFLKK